MILAGDLGGTKCNLGLFTQDGDKLELIASQRYATREYAQQPFENILNDFKARAAKLTGAALDGNLSAAGFGGAGAVVNGVLHGTFVPWQLNARNLAAGLGIERVLLINDVEAAAFSLPHLAAGDVLTLSAGAPQEPGTKALIAAGTGLGEAILFWSGRQYFAIPTEGGEADFAPSSEQEIELLRVLRKKSPRVSAEEILSGSGFRAIHEFLAPSVRHASFQMPARDAAEEITQQALAASCPACVDTLNFWTAAYASEAGNLALRTLAFGGVYIGGGIAPKILPKLRQASFFQRFADKGRFSPILARIPLHVVLNENAPLWGAAYEAAAQAETGIPLPLNHH